MSLQDLPAVNATLNALSGILLLVGFTLIRSGRQDLHRKWMIAAFVSSSLFLVSYVVYHAQVGSVRFTREGLVRPLYFAILITHVSLAATVLPLSIVTLTRGLNGRFSQHRAIAKWTFPIWMYVSVTGVLVYVLLYQPTWLL
jgi:putative membrane protein